MSYDNDLFDAAHSAILKLLPVVPDDWRYEGQSIDDRVGGYLQQLLDDLQQEIFSTEV